LGGAGLVAAGFGQRQDPPHHPVPGGVVAAQHHRTEGGVGRWFDQGRGWAVLEADPQCFQAQPGDRGGVAGQVGCLRSCVDQAGGGEQRGVGEVGPGQIAGGVGVIQPLVPRAEPVVKVGGEPVRSREGDAEFPQRLQPEPERLRETGPVGHAAHLHRRRVRAVHHGRARPFDRAVHLVGLLQPP
jgi:hypothetical protein